jgi:hypothetical protein
MPGYNIMADAYFCSGDLPKNRFKDEFDIKTATFKVPEIQNAK